VVEAANAAREAHADLILTVGGGSVTDAAKMVGLCLGNDVTQPSALDAYRATTASDGSTIRAAVKAPAVRFIAIPTTLSAGEFNASADSSSDVSEFCTVGQPAVSKLVGQLEDRLGVKLLVRTTRGMTATEAGLNYHERVRRPAR
jgi:alcohol dehydrogenase class IV